MPDTEQPDSRPSNPSKAPGDRAPLERRRALSRIGAAVGGGAAALAGLDLLGSEPASAGTLNGPNILNGPNTLDGTSQANTLKGTNLLQGTSGLGNVLSGRNTFADASVFTGDAYFASGHPWYDVRAFGAKGDGTTDDLGAIGTAIAALAKTGGALVFPPGQYLVSSTIAFSGISNFMIEMSGAEILSGLHAGGQLTPYVSFDSCTDFLANGGTVGSSFTPVTRGNCPAVFINSCNRFSFSGTKVAQSEGPGFYTTGLSSHGCFMGCFVQNTKADGFDTFSSANGSPSQITYHGCSALGTGDDSFEVVTYRDQPVVADVAFVGNSVLNSASRGIVLEGATRATILGNVITNVAAAGMSIGCDAGLGDTEGVNEAVAAANVIDQSGTLDGPNGSWPSIDISANGGVACSDILFNDNLLTNLRWRGIQVQGPPMSRVRVAGNRITGAPALAINVSGAQDVDIRGNAIYDCANQAVLVDSASIAPITVADNRVFNAGTARTGNLVALDMEKVTAARVANNEIFDPNRNLQAAIDLTGSVDAVLAGNGLDGAPVRPALSYAPAAWGSPLQLGPDAQAGATIYTGAGAPTLSGKAGDLFIRTDAPSTAQQRLYMCVSGTNWSGIA